ncbi:hypothetical protein CC2G_009680 [Coprinopsis cinerea AmutBmut pab1-1]|nr:hypothetical protein CC2G_009680 [Coprinopsis cinerea AmutBmut pab1-1]
MKRRKYLETEAYPAGSIDWRLSSKSNFSITRTLWNLRDPNTTVHTVPVNVGTLERLLVYHDLPVVIRRPTFGTGFHARWKASKTGFDFTDVHASARNA